MCLRPSLQMSGQQMQQIQCLSTAVEPRPVGPVCAHTHTHTQYLVLSGLNLCSHTGSAVWWATGERETSVWSCGSFRCAQHSPPSWIFHPFVCFRRPWRFSFIRFRHFRCRSWKTKRGKRRITEEKTMFGVKEKLIRRSCSTFTAQQMVKFSEGQRLNGTDLTNIHMHTNTDKERRNKTLFIYSFAFMLYLEMSSFEKEKRIIN